VGQGGRERGLASRPIVTELGCRPAVPKGPAGPEGVGEPGAGARLRAGTATWKVPVIVIALYAGLAIVAYLPVLPLSNGQIPAAKLNDSISVAWFLDWVATAIRHGRDPLFSTYLDHPVGVNLAVNQSMSLAGALSAPVSWLLGPFAAFNLWLRVAFVASAASMYLVLRRYVTRELSAFLGGLLYGFSPFVVGHSLISPNFSLVAVPPVMVVLVDDLLRRDQRSARRDGLLAGLVATVQLYLNPEVLADMVLAMTLAAAIVLPRRLGQDGWGRLQRLVVGGLWALVPVGVLGAPFLWLYLAGPQHLHGPVVPLHYLVVFRTDLAGLVVPNINQRLGPSRLIALGTSYTSYAINETGVYFGVPLLVVLGYLMVRLRHDRLIAYCSALAGTGLVLSLGRSLVVDNHHTGWWLPGALLLHVPVLQSAEPIRMILFAYLGASVILAVGMDRLADAVGRRPRRRGAPRASTAAVVMVAAVVLVPLVPRWPYRFEGTAIPSYFTSGAYRQIPQGAVAMTYPYDGAANVTPEMWQMASGFRFVLVGGYAYIADNGGVPFGSPPVRPSPLVDLLVGADTSGPSPLPVPGPATNADIRSALRAMGVEVFLLQRVGSHPGLVVADLTAALGRRPVFSGGMLVWYHVGRDLRARDLRARDLRVQDLKQAKGSGPVSSPARRSDGGRSR